MAENIRDFNDYAKPIDFKFGDNVYRIPAFGKNKIEKLMEINNQFTGVLDEDVDPESEEINKETIEKNKKFFEMQDNYIASAILKKEGDQFKEITEEELIDWPIRVKNQVMSAITEQMSTVSDEDVEKKS